MWFYVGLTTRLEMFLLFSIYFLLNIDHLLRLPKSIEIFWGGNHNLNEWLIWMWKTSRTQLSCQMRVTQTHSISVRIHSLDLNNVVGFYMNFQLPYSFPRIWNRIRINIWSNWNSGRKSFCILNRFIFSNNISLNWIFSTNILIEI